MPCLQTGEISAAAAWHPSGRASLLSVLLDAGRLNSGIPSAPEPHLLSPLNDSGASAHLHV